MRTQVGIVGAGPAGADARAVAAARGNRFGHHREPQPRLYRAPNQGRAPRAVGGRSPGRARGRRPQCRREGMFHRGIHLNFDGELHHIDFRNLICKGVTIYGQQEVVKDLVARLARRRRRDPVRGRRRHDPRLRARHAKIRFHHDGAARQIDCDFIGGCDGFSRHLPAELPGRPCCRRSSASNPFGWDRSILAESPPPEDELIYTYHDRGFALFTMRSPELARLYLQCAPDEDIESWPDARIWEELRVRLNGVRPLAEGRMLQKGITPMRQLRGRADAGRPAVSRRRFRPHRAADRRQGHEPRDRRRARSVARAHRILSIEPDRPARRLFADVPGARLEGRSASPGG